MAEQKTKVVQMGVVGAAVNHSIATFGRFKVAFIPFVATSITFGTVDGQPIRLHDPIKSE